MSIPTDMLKRFNMQELADYKERHGDTVDTERTFYQTFLLQTDYIPSKLMEAQLAGETLDEDYSTVLQYRKEAREEINRLKVEVAGLSGLTGA